MTDEIETSWITISRILSESGDDIRVTCSDDLDVIEGAGMLTMALDSWMGTNGLRNVPE